MSGITPILHNLAQVKDSRWLTLEVCREFQRDKCSRSAEECKFAHPPQHVEVNNGRVVCCFDSIKGKCQRREPPCKYLHPPQHLREQLLQNGRNNLIMRQIQMTALAQSMQPTLLPAAGAAATAAAPQHILQPSSQPVLPLQYPLLPNVQAGATSPAAALQTAYQNPTLYHPAYNSALFQAQNIAPTASIFATPEQTSANSPTPSVSSTPSTSATTTKTAIRTASNVAEPATALDSGQGKKRPHEDDTPTVAVLNPAHSLLAPNIKRLAVDKSGVPSLPAYGPAPQLPTAIPVSMPTSVLPTSVFSQQQMAYIPAAYPHLAAGGFMPITGHPGNLQRF